VANIATFSTPSLRADQFASPAFFLLTITPHCVFAWVVPFWPLMGWALPLQSTALRAKNPVFPEGPPLPTGAFSPSLVTTGPQEIAPRSDVTLVIRYSRLVLLFERPGSSSRLEAYSFGGFLLLLLFFSCAKPLL